MMIKPSASAFAERSASARRSKPYQPPIFHNGCIAEQCSRSIRVEVIAMLMRHHDQICGKLAGLERRFPDWITPAGVSMMMKAWRMAWTLTSRVSVLKLLLLCPSASAVNGRTVIPALAPVAFKFERLVWFI
jgi:hypothetical protein